MSAIGTRHITRITSLFGHSVVLVMIVVFLAGGVLVRSRYTGYREIIAVERERAEVQAVLITEYLSSSLRLIDSMLVSLAERVAPSASFGPDGIQIVTDTYLRFLEVPELDSILILDAAGQEAALYPPSATVPEQNLLDTVTATHRDGLITAAITIEPDRDRIILSRTIDQPDRGFGGAALALINFEYLARHLLDYEMPGFEAVAVTTSDGESLTWKTVSRREDSPGDFLIQPRQTGVSSLHYEDRIYGYARMRYFPVLVTLRFSLDRPLHAWTGVTYRVGLLFLVISIATILGARFLQLQVGRRIQAESESERSHERTDLLRLLSDVERIAQSGAGDLKIVQVFMRRLSQFIGWRTAVGVLIFEDGKPEEGVQLYCRSLTGIMAIPDSDGVVMESLVPDRRYAHMTDSGTLSRVVEYLGEYIPGSYVAACVVPVTAVGRLQIGFAFLRAEGDPVSAGTSGVLQYAFRVLCEVMERKQVVDALRFSERRYRSLFDNLPVGVGVFRFGETGKLRITDNNPSFSRVIDKDPGDDNELTETAGYRSGSGADSFGTGHLDRMTGPDLIETFREVDRSGHTRRMSYHDKDTGRYFDLTVFSTRDGHIAAAVMEISRQVENIRLLRRAVKEKELLLREIHHRVKNNLNIISSLIHLQSRQTQNPVFQDAMDGTQKRIQSISFIHGLLYLSDNLGEIHFRRYCEQLSGGLSVSGPDSGETVSIHLNVPEIYLDIDTVKALGLIITEATTNAIKYGKNESGTAEIEISFSREKDRNRLTIINNGPPFPPEYLEPDFGGLGMFLTRTLTDELEGRLQFINTDEAVGIAVDFPATSRRAVRGYDRRTER